MKTNVAQIDLDNIYDYVDSMLRMGEWTDLDLMFYRLIPQAEIMPLDIMLAYATASLSGKSKLPCRQQFVAVCKELHPGEELWKGL